MPRKRESGGCSCGMAVGDIAKTAVCRTAGCPFPHLAERRDRPRVRERDLSHDADSVRFGAAMLKCEGYAPGCSEAGRCTNGGRCFGSAPNLIAARMVEAMIPGDGHTRGVHYAYLRRLAEMLRNDEIHL